MIWPSFLFNPSSSIPPLQSLHFNPSTSIPPLQKSKTKKQKKTLRRSKTFHNFSRLNFSYILENHLINFLCQRIKQKILWRVIDFLHFFDKITFPPFFKESGHILSKDVVSCTFNGCLNNINEITILCWQL